MRSNEGGGGGGGGGGGACKPGLQASAIRKASLHADHPPICLKYCVSAQKFNTAMLLSVKRWGIISVIILFYYTDPAWLSLTNERKCVD